MSRGSSEGPKKIDKYIQGKYVYIVARGDLRDPSPGTHCGTSKKDLTASVPGTLFPTLCALQQTETQLQHGNRTANDVKQEPHTTHRSTNASRTGG